MSQLDKLRQRIEQNPKSVRFEDLDHLLQGYGFARRPGKGSHHFYWQGEYRVVVPHRRPHVLPIYVKLVLEVIDQIMRG